MPLDAAMVGEQTREFTKEVDSRWLMAYAAGLGDCNPRYMDTAAGVVMGHPVFPVCLEWDVILSSRELKGYETVTPEESARGVHAAHDLHLHKPIVAGETYTTRATVVGLEKIKPGAAQTTKLETFDSKGELVSTTWQLGISRGVEVTGKTGFLETPPALPDLSAGAPGNDVFELPVAEGAANIYTETARIFNPIHSDRAFALAAGLPDIILHGTATLALGVSKLCNEYLDGDATRIKRLGGRFSGMVLMPSTLKLEVKCRSESQIAFELLNPDGKPAFSQGFICLD